MTYNDQLNRMGQLEKIDNKKSKFIPLFKDSITITSTADTDSENVVNTTSRLIAKIIGWHYDRNLIDGSSDKDQTLKLLQELGELSDSVCKGKDIRDDLGDMLVVMLNIMERNNLSINDCLLKAYDDIKDRKGRMVNGVFIKEQDEV